MIVIPFSKCLLLILFLKMASTSANCTLEFTPRVSSSSIIIAPTFSPASFNIPLTSFK